MGSRAGRFAAAIGVCGIAMLGTAAVAHAAFLYVAGGPDKIGGHNIESNGALTSLGATTTGSTPRSLAITPDAKHLYVIAIGSDSVLGYDIAAGGSLSPVAGMPVGGFPLGDNANDPTSIAVTPNGAFLYASWSGGTGTVISAWSIGANGTLAPVPGSPFALADTQGLAVDPSGARLYATTNAGVQSFTIAGNGSLSALGAVVPVGASRAIAIRPDSSVMYVGQGGVGTRRIQALTIAADGTLTPGSTTPTDPAGDPNGVVVTPTNQFVYTANFAAAGTVSAFSIGAAGALLPVSGQPFAVGANTFPYAADAAPNGVLYVANDVGGGGQPGSVTAFLIAADGVLTSLGTVPSNTDGPEFQSIAATPNQGPVAAITATSAAAGSPTTLDASASADSDGGGAIGSYAWDFGDGQTATTTTATTQHVYAQPGTHTATVTVTDPEGCSTQTIFTGQTADCNGSSAATTSTQVTVPPGGSDPPDLRLSGPRAQRLDAAVEVGARCDEACTVAASGKLIVRTPSGRRVALAVKRFNLRPVSAQLDGKKKRTLKLKLPRKARRAGLRALNRGGRVRARLVITATNNAGASETERRGVRLVKPKRKR